MSLKARTTADEGAFSTWSVRASEKAKLGVQSIDNDKKSSVDQRDEEQSTKLAGATDVARTLARTLAVVLFRRKVIFKLERRESEGATV